MKDSHLGYSSFVPLLRWNGLAMKAAEMMLASAQVIGHRTVRLAAAGPHPNARDRREFAMMLKEKVEAGAQAYKNMLRSSVAFLALANSRTPRQLMLRQAALARALWNNPGSASPGFRPKRPTWRGAD